ncbi:MAG: response regulator transcription factor [Acidobacteria bacterium]|nr:response regulator transcription factor [Acidobacteriota bacterium]MBV9477008.1 response regulator transcription factor [Acidobacteriota bacterium]
MKILIADDHSVVRRGLQQVISERPDWSVVAESSSAEDVLPALRRTPVDLVMLDVSLGERSGIDVLGHIRAEFPNVPVLIFSMHNEEQYAIRCLRAGAAGYVPKDSSPETILEAIERAATGRTYVTPAVAEQLAAGLTPGVTVAPHEMLSDREFEVFRLIATGRSLTDIAESLSLSIKTVSTYRTRILQKTGFRSNAEIIAYGIRTGLV